MKIKITKRDFVEYGGKLFLDYLDILTQWESKSVEKTLNLLAEKIAKQFLIDQGFNENNWSEEKHTLHTAGRQIREMFISKASAIKNFEIDIEFDTDTGEIKIVEPIPNTESGNRQTEQQMEPVTSEGVPKERNKSPESEEVIDVTETFKNHSRDLQTEHNVDIVEQAIRMSNCFVMIPKLKQTQFPY